MPTLNWIGKEAVINHHKEVPFRLLKCRADLSVGDPDSGNLLVQGDNLEALKALLPYYAGQVKCIYIDPPYNTGNEGWVYNDNVNSAEMREWLGKVVGGEAEDLSRHDKWLSMMYPRIALLREMLSDEGSIWISVDDNEQANCRLLCNEIFGENNFIVSIAWHKRISPANDAKYFSNDHDYILVFAKNKNIWRPNRLDRNEEQLEYYKNPDNDPRGPWNSAAYTSAKTAEERPNLYYPITNPNTGEEILPSKVRVWAYDQSTHKYNVENNLIYWGKDGKGKMPRMKKFLSEGRLVVPRSMWEHKDSGHNQEAKLESNSILPENFFSTPKPTRLIQKIIQIGTNPGDLVLDSFAGSGTTGHSVLKQNMQDSGNRRFILVEMENAIASKITAERIKRAINGYGDNKGLGGGFRYCELGATLFDPNRQIREEVKYNDLAQHVYFVETGQPLPQNAKKHFPLLGVANETAVYLLYNGILKDKSVNGGNVLTNDVLDGLPKHEGAKVIYGNGCRIGANRLREMGITFKQIPYEIREI